MKSVRDLVAYVKKEYVFLATCLALIVCTSFAGGLNWHRLIIPLILIICPLIKSRIRLSAVGYSAVVIFVCAISLFNTKGDFQTGLYETEKIIFFVAAIMLGTQIKRKDILSCIYITAVVSAISGLLIYCGLIDSGEYILDYSGQVRLQGLFKYANVAACFWGMGYYAYLDIMVSSSKARHSYFGMLILIAMYLTLSKAAIPIFLAVGLYYIHKKRETASVFVNNNIISVVFCIPTLLLAQKRMFFIVFLMLVICVILGANIKVFKSDDRAARLGRWAFVLAVLAGILLFIFRQSIFSTMFQRFTYMKDSLENIAPYMISGSGPGSWRLLKYAFQSGSYNVMYMHNGFLQFLFENGPVFTLLILYLIIKAVAVGIKEKSYCHVAMIFLCVIHSCIDFDLSFGAMLMALGIITGNFCFTKDTQNRLLGLISSRIAVGFLCVVVIYMTAEYTVRSSFEADCVKENYVSALEKAHYLEKLCPGDSVLQLNIAALIEKTSGDYEDVKSRIDNSCKLSPNDPDLYEAYINYNMTGDNLRELCLKYVAMRPKYEGTHKKVKDFINRAYSKSIIDEEYKNTLLEEMKSLRSDLHVGDRDELLDRIMQERIKSKQKGAN